MNMNERIRKFIKSEGLTYTSVANLSGINLKKISRIMLNKQKIDIDSYELICKALEVSPRYFYKENFLDNKNKSA
ncbi:helix-turn-helix domain-containing protein [Chengkuizengella marina]|uniref:XRE family transcriptional regulator n=1 Tax=Chengkuizengella marina TaxID=2507566 RepID=A0A6N9Q2U4_9BACL|nr:helix-turn-helix transcriptional regulator [Chengkuizengella marina]NBI29115.1 XRE family transcriptional regulator [Chengkuizengella marina]